MPLPPLPEIELSEEEDLTPPQPPGYMRLRRRRARLVRGRRPSEAFVFDSVERAALDAVVVAAHHRGDDGRRYVWLRSAFRPATALRPPDKQPFPEGATLGSFWEVVAGLLEPDEVGGDGTARCAARELDEELGFAIDPSRFEPLGPSLFPAAAIIAERQHFFHVEVDPARRGTPSEDGSVLEQGALVVAIPLDEALALVRAGAIEDAKTEIALRRLAELE